MPRAGGVVAPVKRGRKKKCEESDGREGSPAVANKRKNPTVDADQSPYLFECPICMEHFGGEVFQCTNGHLVCSKCIKKITKCPSCQVPMSKLRIRNRAVEELAPTVNYECPNRYLGCMFKCKLPELDTHVSTACRYVSFAFCKTLGLKCSADVMLAELGKHLKEHGIPGCETDEVCLRPSSRTAVSLANRKQPVQNLLVFLSVYGHIFTVESVFDFLDRSLSFVVRVVGRSEKVNQRFGYKIVLKPSHAENAVDSNTTVTTYEGKVVCQNSFSEDNVTAESSFPSIPQRKLKALGDTMSSMTISVKPLDGVPVGSPGPPKLTTLSCNWAAAGNISNIGTSGTPFSSPMSPKTPNRRIPGTVTLRKQALTK